MPINLQPDIELVSNEMVKIGLLSCFAGFTQSAFELFETLHDAFPDTHGPIMGMVYVLLAQSKLDEGTALLEKNKKLFMAVDAEDDFKIMQVFIDWFSQDKSKAITIL